MCKLTFGPSILVGWVGRGHTSRVCSDSSLNFVPRLVIAPDGIVIVVSPGPVQYVVARVKPVRRTWLTLVPM